MGKYFTISEFCSSETADKLGIDNMPTSEHVLNIERVIVILDGLREKWGSPIVITSGYRSQELNNAIKGSSKTSVHRFGLAADMQPANGCTVEFWSCCKEYFADKKFDQLLFEHKSGGVAWVHFGLSLPNGQQRRQIKELYV
jgi:hypothetical protein